MAPICPACLLRPRAQRTNGKFSSYCRECQAAKVKKGREPKGGRGGVRLGAGRKPDPNKRKVVGFRLPPDLVEKLRKEPGQTKLIEQLLREYYEAPV